MKQEKLWDFYQNSHLSETIFPEARQRYFASRLTPGTRVLNIGIGAGQLELLALNKGVDIHTLDPSERAIKNIQDKLKLGDKAKIGYAQSIPFPNDYFDAVIMSEVLEHLDDETLEKTLAEVLRVLRTDGVLLASTPYSEQLEANIVVCPDCGKLFHKVGHVQSFDKQKMRKLLVSSGFAVERLYIGTFIDWSRPGIFSLLKSIIRWILAKMGQGIADPHLLVKAKKSK